MAPELFNQGVGYSQAADVHSFAMLLFELVSHELPFATSSPLQAAFAVAVEGARPPLPAGTPPPVVDLTSRCWAAQDKRPRFAEILEEVMADGWLAPGDVAWLDEPLGHPVYSVQQHAYPVDA
jgi:hypothetical protein